MDKGFKIIRKEGFILNPNDDEVNDILKKLEDNGGHCPTNIHKRRGHDQCPCAQYLENDTCYCGLYIKKDDKIQRDEWGW